MSKPKTSKTHFEQVPLEIVKKIAEVEAPRNKENVTDVIIEPPEKE